MVIYTNNFTFVEYTIYENHLQHLFDIFLSF